MPWKNGGGLTYEMWRDPPGVDAFRCRLSVARIEACGPFSDFSGYQRSLVLLQGDGLYLDFADGERRGLAHVGEMTRFGGGRRVTGRLAAGPTMDLNLMVAQGAACDGGRVLSLAAAQARVGATGGTTLLVCIAGRIRVRWGEQQDELRPWDLAVIEAPTPSATAAATEVHALGVEGASVAAVGDRSTPPNLLFCAQVAAPVEPGAPCRTKATSEADSSII